MKLPAKLLLPPMRRDLVVAHLAAAGVAAHLLEATIPGFGPWFKPGLANVFTLLAFMLLGWRAAVAVSLIRVVAGSLFLGTFFSPAFFLSLTGTLLAVGGLGVARLLALPLGPVGLSIPAAMLHMTGQVVVASWLVVGHPGLLLALPWFLAGSWVAGLASGLLAYFLLIGVESHRSLLEQSTFSD